MIFRDLRDFIGFLENKGELRRITVPVSHELEITELADRAVKTGGPALLFERVEGFDVPVLINIFGTHQRVAWALGVDDIEQLAGKIKDTLGLVQGPPVGIIDKVAARARYLS